MINALASWVHMLQIPKVCRRSDKINAGEGEYVQFSEDCVCDGPVEVWLQNVVNAMRSALSSEFKAAITTYDEKPRGKWIFDYSAQNTIVVSRTFFTADVNAAFEDLEEGNEDALKVPLRLLRLHVLLSTGGSFQSYHSCVLTHIGSC